MVADALSIVMLKTTLVDGIPVVTDKIPVSGLLVSVAMVIDVTNYVSGTVIDFSIEVSLDEGASWKNVGGAWIEHPPFNLDQTLAPQSGCTCLVDSPVQDYFARGTILVSGGNLKTSAKMGYK